MGGGLGITYNDESPPQLREYAGAIVEPLEGMNLQLILEPGRVIVGNAGVLVTRVLYRKSGESKEFVIADAAMNDLMRPTLYNAFHAVHERPENLGHRNAPILVLEILEYRYEYTRRCEGSVIQGMTELRFPILATPSDLESSRLELMKSGTGMGI